MSPDAAPPADLIVRAVELLADAFDARAVRYALIGGLGASLRGRPRYTKDADFILEVPQLVLPGLLEDLTDRGFSLDPVEVIRQFVRDHITAFLYQGVRIDWLKPVLPLYATALAGATPVPWGDGRTVRVASAEGLILTKLAAFRPQDQIDIGTLLAANRDSIDVGAIESGWAALAALEPARTAWLRDAVAKFVTRAK